MCLSRWRVSALPAPPPPPPPPPPAHYFKARLRERLVKRILPAVVRVMGQEAPADIARRSVAIASAAVAELLAAHAADKEREDRE